MRIHDVTLRDGEQQAGIIYRKDDKIRIAEKLAEAGVHRIETGMPAVSPMDEAAIREIVKRNLGPEIFCFSRCIVDDVKRAADCGVKGVVIEIPVSAHMVEQAYKWTLEKAIDLSIKATAAAKKEGLYTVFFTIDGTRADMDFLLNLVDRVATEGHMDAFTLVDTFGVLNPQAATYFTRKVKERVKKPVEVHFHSDFGLGVANTIMAVLSGAEVIHSTVGGIGERCGNAPMEETALALLTMYGIDVGHQLRQDQRALQSRDEAFRDRGPAQSALRRREGLHRRIGDRHRMVPERLHGQPDDRVSPSVPSLSATPVPEIIMGKKSGVDNIAVWAEKLGLKIDDDKKMEILKRIKRRSHDLRRVLTEKEFKEIVKEVKAGK